MLDENHHLIQCIMDYQSKGKTAECTQYQQILHRNLVYLATIADSNQNMQSLLPAVSSAHCSPDRTQAGQDTPLYSLFLLFLCSFVAIFPLFCVLFFIICVFNHF
uniref:SS18 N-terminal domain-containing protein n=1 Tax=Astyanax mexicanus TaxID=7994 RepID=A0A3B1JM15_ASTMX